MPESDTLSGSVVALVAILSFADRLPVTVGANFTLIEHDAPTASVAGQLLVCEKWLAFVPVSVMPCTENDTVPLFDNVATSAPLVVLITWL